MPGVLRTADILLNSFDSVRSKNLHVTRFERIHQFTHNVKLFRYINQTFSAEIVKIKLHAFPN